MLRNLNIIICLMTLIVIISGCANKKNIVLFQENNKNVFNEYKYNNQKIQVDDIINVRVSALDMSSVIAFVDEKLQNTHDNYLIKGYKIDEKGNTNLPILGEIKLLGLTSHQASKKIQDKLSESIINPVVTITIVSAKITILGEVNNPGTFSLYNPKINVIQALGLAGGFKSTGKRKDIVLLRNTDGKVIRHEINLTNNDFINLETFYLKNNDVIYVEPTFASIKNSGYIGSINNIATIFSLVMSIIILGTNN